MSRLPITGANSENALSRGMRGFTLIELISVIIILGVLAAIAVPSYIALGRDARLASIQMLSGTIWASALNVRAACALSSTCDINNSGQAFTIASHSADLNWGWLNAGDGLNTNQIDAWINYSGFTASLVDGLTTKFSLDNAPTPTNCAVTYQEATANPLHIPTVTSITSGC